MQQTPLSIVNPAPDKVLLVSLNQRLILIGCFDGHRGGHARRRGPEQVPDPHPTSAQDRPVGDDDAGRGETGRHVQ